MTVIFAHLVEFPPKKPIKRQLDQVRGQGVVEEGVVDVWSRFGHWDAGKRFQNTRNGAQHKKLLTLLIQNNNIATGKINCMRCAQTGHCDLVSWISG
jgi:hypothetical protein